MDELAGRTGEALRGVAASIDGAHLDRAVTVLRGTPRVLVLAVGSSGAVAQDAAFRLVGAGILAHAPTDGQAQQRHAGLLQCGDVALAISHSGTSQPTVAAASAARAAGAAVIALTSFSAGPLVDVAEVVLVAGARRARHLPAETTSRAAHLLVLDALLSCLLAGARDGSP